MGKLVKLIANPSFKIWGGNKLSLAKNIKGELPLGETWEISTHKEGSSLLADVPLSQLCQLRYLFKYIDTDDNLSIQVHPTDDYALTHENEKGKTECWIILDCEVGAGIYLGFKPGVTKKEFKTAISNGLAVDKFLNFIEVKPGDYFYVPAGSIHALGKGVTLAEIQQSSGLTYRVWDWGRLGQDGKARELHIDKAMDVINFDENFNNLLLTRRQNLFEKKEFQKVVEHSEFKADLMSLSAHSKKEIRLNDKEGVSVLEGKVKIDDIMYSRFDSGICLDQGIVTIEPLMDSKLLFIRE